MQQQISHGKKRRMTAMVWLGAITAVITLILRVWLMPLLRDMDTGRFATSWVVVLFLLVMLVVLAVCAFSLRCAPPAMGRRGAMLLSVSAMGAGGVMAISSLWDVWQLLAKGQQPALVIETSGVIGTVSLWLMLAFGLLGGGALVWWGLQLSAEGATRRGMGNLALLAPTLWMWFRLARYEMSYASAVGLSETFYDLMMFVFGLLFLYKMARYVVGVGTPCLGSLLFFSLSSALFSLTGPLTRVCMYLAGDGEAFRASQMAGWSDFALGVLALVFAGVMVTMALAPAQEESPEEEPSSDAASSASEETPETWGDNQP